MRLRPLATFLALAGVAALSGCGGSGSSEGSPAGGSSPPPPPTSCTVLERGTALSVKFTASDSESACDQWIRARGKQGEFWSRSGQPNEQQSVACIFTNGSGAQAEIDDGGGQMFAQTFCAAFAGQQGWREDTQAEEAIANRAKRAQARAAATQQAKDTITSDASAVANDLSDLRDATAGLGGDSLAGDISGLKDGLTSIRSDLQTVQSDSSDLVCGDAGIVSGDEGSMEGDRGSMEGDIGLFQNDIGSVVSAIASLKRDHATYVKDSAATGYYSTDIAADSAISTAITAGQNAVARERARITSARNQADQLISQAKGYVAEANALCRRAGG